MTLTELATTSFLIVHVFFSHSFFLKMPSSSMKLSSRPYCTVGVEGAVQRYIFGIWYYPYYSWDLVLSLMLSTSEIWYDL